LHKQVETLRSAIEYIKALEAVVEKQRNNQRLLGTSAVASAEVHFTKEEKSASKILEVLETPCESANSLCTTACNDVEEKNNQEVFCKNSLVTDISCELIGDAGNLQDKELLDSLTCSQFQASLTCCEIVDAAFSLRTACSHTSDQSFIACDH